MPGISLDQEDLEAEMSFTDQDQEEKDQVLNE